MIKTKFYSHSDKSSNFETAKELGLSERATEDFVYVGYELELDIEINEDTGETFATSLNGVSLTKPVKI